MALEERVELLALAHVRAAPDFAGVLRAVRVDAPAEVEEPVGFPLGGVGDDFVEEVLETLGLCSVRGQARYTAYLEETQRAFRMVEMKTELAFERQKNIVLGFEPAFSFLTARTMAGCYWQVQHQYYTLV